MRRLAALVAFVLILYAFAVPASAPAADNLRLDINAIDEKQGELAVSLNVMGSDGKPVAGLNDGNFRVSLNNTRVQLASVEATSAARQPAAILLLVDVSGSMAGDPINQARAAMQAFVQELDPADSVAIISFSAGVTPVQDFTTDRAILNDAIARLPAVGDTALYDGVIAAASKIATVPAGGGKRLIVLLSDGEATQGLDKRGASIAAIQQTGVGVVVIGEGPQIDRAYLGELAAASGGRFLEAPTPASLRQVYADLASTIRSQYTLKIAVPPSVDRSADTKLSITATFRTDTGTVERTLGPLAGAAPPPFTLGLQGIREGAKVKSTTAIQPVASGGVSLAKVEYVLDGELVQTATEAPFGASLDPSHLATGSHTLVVTGTDSRGRSGQTQVSFGVGSAGGSSLPTSLILVLALAIGFAGVLFLYLQKRGHRIDGYADRVRPWAGRIPVQNGPATRPLDWPEPPPVSAAAAAAAAIPAADRVLGRVVLMNEGAVRDGALDAIQEVEIKSTPLTFGSGSNSDLKVDDLDGRIAAEEARLWVQKGRLVYHKLTTLSAMATEGVTSGWEFLESGEDMRIGPYRLVFQAAEPEAIAEPVPEPLPTRLPQEHGMEIRDLWTRVVDNQAQQSQQRPPEEPYDPLLDDPSLTPQP